MANKQDDIGTDTIAGYNPSKMKKIIAEGIKYSTLRDGLYRIEQPVDEDITLRLGPANNTTDNSYETPEDTPKSTMVRAKEPTSTRHQAVGGPVPAGHLYKGKELADVVDNAVLAYAMRNGLAYFAPLNEDFQDGGMARGYRGVASHSDDDGFVDITSEVPVFIKAVTGGNMRNYLEEADKQQAICAKAPSAAKLYFSHVETMKDGAAVLIIGMEDIVGENVQRYVDRNPALKWWYDVEDKDERKEYLKQVLSLFKDIVDAVGEIHSAGYVHRDVKPGNFMRTTKGRIKSLDFASAMKTGERPDKNEVFHGTPEYCSLEHITGGADVKMDVFSLGCILYEFMTGNPPYTEAAAKARQRKNDEVSQEKLGQDITNRLITAMIKDERYRNPDAEESLNELQGICDELTFIVEHSTSINPEQRFANCSALSYAIEQVIDKIDAHKLLAGPIKSCEIDEKLYRMPTGEVQPLTERYIPNLADAELFVATLRRISEPNK